MTKFSSDEKAPGDRRGFGRTIPLCPLGLAVALLAHLLLCGVAVLMGRHHPVYYVGASAYLMLSVVLAQKAVLEVVRKWRLHQRPDAEDQNRHEARWENEYDIPYSQASKR